MTVQPLEDPSDPLVIRRDLPEREREEFLNQYPRGRGCRREGQRGELGSGAGARR